MANFPGTQARATAINYISLSSFCCELDFFKCLPQPDALITYIYGLENYIQIAIECRWRWPGKPLLSAAVNCIFVHNSFIYYFHHCRSLSCYCCRHRHRHKKRQLIGHDERPLAVKCIWRRLLLSVNIVNNWFSTRREESACVRIISTLPQFTFAAFRVYGQCSRPVIMLRELISAQFVFTPFVCRFVRGARTRALRVAWTCRTLDVCLCNLYVRKSFRCLFSFSMQVESE